MKKPEKQNPYKRKTHIKTYDRITSLKCQEMLYQYIIKKDERRCENLTTFEIECLMAQMDNLDVCHLLGSVLRSSQETCHRAR